MGTILDPEKSSPEKGKGGRPTKFTPKNCKRILKSIRLGSPLNLACKGAGVDYSTMRGWVTQGETVGKGEYFTFSQQLEKAQGDFVDAHLANIQTASKRTWQASAWLLERTRPQDFSRSVLRVEGEVKNIDRKEQDITIRILSDEKTSKHATRLAAGIARQLRIPSGSDSS